MLSRRFGAGRFLLLLGVVGLASFSAVAPTWAAEPPTYRTIAPIQARPKQGETRYRAQVQALPAQPYAWGWFGARPRSQGAWQRGYYGDVRFWSRTGW
ncbi:MAG: hypothetical protein WD875_02355 [Pirellulales bacterium]